MKPIIGITGGAGYIGSSLAKRLSKNFEIKLLDVREPIASLPQNAIFEKCDIRSFEEVKKAVDGVDLIIHTAIIQIPAINEQKN